MNYRPRIDRLIKPTRGRRRLLRRVRAQMASDTAPVRFGLTGLGGYAGYVCDRIITDSRRDQPSATLVGVCEPEPERHPRRVADLQAAGVSIVRDFAALLALPIEAVWLPLPIDLHYPYTAMALHAGKAVLCEKPAAGCVDDVDAMIAARDRTGLPVAIGFQDMYQPSVATLKDRLIAGEFGRPLSASVIGCWPRSERYFGRNDWAGRMRRDNRWVMDSPASNALAHFLHLALFLLGGTRGGSARPVSVAAELYRANRIENYDTCTMKFGVGRNEVTDWSEPDLPLTIAYTHACQHAVEPIVLIETEAARISYVSGRHIEIMNGTQGELLPLSSSPHKHMLASFKTWVRQGTNVVIGSTLESARAHVVAFNAASEATPIVDVPMEFIDVLPEPDQSRLRAIQGIVPALQSCISDRCFLHETGLAPWSRPPSTLLINGYSHFRGPAGSHGRSPVTPAPEATIAPSRVLTH